MASEKRLVSGEFLLVGTRSTHRPEVSHANVLVLASLRVLQNKNSLRHVIFTLLGNELDTTGLQRRNLNLVKNEFVFLHVGKDATTSEKIANLEKKKYEPASQEQRQKRKDQASKTDE